LTANGKWRIFAFSEQKLSPSIFVYNFPELQLKNELKGTAQLDYTSLALCDGGPYLACCSSLPDHTITVWNWENAESVCTQPQAGKDVTSLVFNPQNWFQLCALGTTHLTVWNIEKSSCLLCCSVIELPATDGSFVERLSPTPYLVSNKLSNWLQRCLLSLKGDKELLLSPLLTPSAICWTATSELCVGCAEGFLLLVDPESFSVSVLFNPTSKQTCTLGCGRYLKTLAYLLQESMVHCLQIKGTQIDIEQTWQLERAVKTVMYSPDQETLLLSSKSVST
uniref:Cilia- and flagella-associated protein 43 n=1 Tax=Stegastes partitus TaxID=144197 RepID=A0A3B5B2P3_9TELE